MSLRPRRWPLRRRMTAAMVVLLVVVVAVVGGISLAVQRGALMLRMDEQLQSDLHMMEGALDDPGGAASADGPAGDADGRSPRPRVDSLHVVEQADGTRTAELVDASGEVEELDAAAVEEILAASAEEAATVDLGDHGGYRVLSASAADDLDRDGARGRQDPAPQDAEVLAVGQSMEEVERTSRDMLLIFSGVALAAVLVATLLARLLAVAGLRPLDRLAATASEVGRTPLASGTVSLSHRVAAEDADPATEVGQVGAAFNQMLDHVESSLQLRQQSEERLRRFIADAGHELRTPLAAISGHLQLSLRRGDQLPEDVARSLERVDAETGRMGTLVEDLLLLARLDVGQQLAREPVDVARVVVDACSDAQVTGPEHQWLIELPDDAADLQVTGDADRLHQVLTNLLANARAHTPAGTTVTVRLLHPRREEVTIEVEDDGPGIPDELRPRIFDRFVRGDDARSRSAGSTGLGMSIAAAIVHAHDGDLTVESRPGRTCFRARLPMTATTSAETGSAEACSEETGSTETRADAPDDADRS